MANVQHTNTSYGSLSAPETTTDPQDGYQPPDGGYQSQPGYLPPPAEEQSQREYSPQIGYPSQAGYQALPGTSSQSGPTAQSGNPHQYGWFEDIKRNKPQIYSMAAATFIFASGGMSFASSVGFGDDFQSKHSQICWFIAVIIGAVISTFFVDKLDKRVVEVISSTLVIVNGALFVAQSDSATSIVIARYCDGIAFGLTLVPAIVAGSEQSVKRFRGLVLSAEHVGLTTGMMVQIVYNTFWGYNWNLNSNQMHGILAKIFGVVALTCTYLFTIESPIFYLRKDNEEEAIDSLYNLQNSDIVSSDMNALLSENRHLLDEDLVRGRTENISSGLVPMVKVYIFRALVTMAFSLPLTCGLFIAVLLNGSEWSAYIYAVARFVGVVIAVFTIDSLGRRLFSAFSLLLGGGFLIALAFLFSNSFQPEKVHQILILLVFYQLFAGIAAPASTCYMGEAFSISVKPYFILMSVILESTIQIIVCCTFEVGNDSVAAYGYALGTFQIVFGIVFFIVMPETKRTTLREALASFRTFLHIEGAHT